MIRLTRLVLVAQNGARIEDDHGAISLDLTGIPNADARTAIEAQVEQQCDLGHWHGVGRVTLPLYDLGRPE